jgi:peptidyl-prolyl cis-trans isomerase C
VIAAASLAATGCSKGNGDSGPVPDGTLSETDPETAAIVNDKPVSMSELRRAVLSVVIQNGMDASHTEAFMAQFGPRILEQLVQGELLYQEAIKGGFSAQPEEIDRSFSEISGRYGSHEEFQAEMENRGFTEKTLRENMSRQITIKKYIEGTVVPEAKVPEETVREAYDQNPSKFQRPSEVRASHILLKIGESDDQEKKGEVFKRAVEIASMAREKGADFAQLARDHSEGPSAPSGGDLGFFARGRMVKPFEDAAFSLEPGEVSDPVLTQFGYHIIKLIERREGLTLPYEEVSDKLRLDLENRMVNEMLSRRITELKESSKIEILFKPAETPPKHP